MLAFVGGGMPGGAGGVAVAQRNRISEFVRHACRAQWCPLEANYSIST